MALSAIFLNTRPKPNVESSIPISQFQAKFGIVGDSWTNFIQFSNTDLKDQLDQRGIGVIGPRILGLTLSSALSQKLYQQAINDTGDKIKYMIISLGGNDYQANLGAYAGVNPSGVAVNSRISTIQTNLISFINDGNTYKKSKYGGSNLIWILYGYDYANVSMSTCSIATPISQSYTTWAISQGISGADVTYVSTTGFNSLNTMYSNLATSSNGEIKYIDLRGTLGGPPNSLSSNMIDCIHPNQNGFKLIGSSYLDKLYPIIGSDR